jgi:hypothetical protein
VTDDDGDAGSGDATHTVHNLDPVINAITSNAPVPQGQPVTLTVAVSDAGVNDTHSYAFDCDNNGSYEAIGAGNQGVCALAPGAASSTIGVQVSDDDLGVVTGSTVVGQTLTVCASAYTGQVAGLMASGACPAGSVKLTLPAASPMTFCINVYTGALVWKPSGGCPAGSRTHLVPNNGPLTYCQSIYTGKLRYVPTGMCSTGERPGVIPG